MHTEHAQHATKHGAAETEKPRALLSGSLLSRENRSAQCPPWSALCVAHWELREAVVLQERFPKGGGA